MDSFFFFKQKTAYEILRSDWSSDVCSSDLVAPCQVHDACIILRRCLKREVQRAGWRQIAQPRWPFHKAYGIAECLDQAQLLDFGDIAETIEIGMPDFALAARIALDKRVGGRGHILGLIERGEDKAAGEMRFARADLTMEQDDITRPKPRRERPRDGASPFRIG